MDNRFGQYLPINAQGTIWDSLSRSFARGAEGTADVFLSATKGVRVASTWATIEFRELVEKGVGIVFHDVF